MSDANDPRSPPSVETDIRPVVARGRSAAPLWLMAALVALGGVVLFGVLDGRRRAATAPTTQASAVDMTTSSPSSSLPPLVLPPEPAPPPPSPLPTSLEPAQLLTPPPQTIGPTAPYAPQPPPPNYAPPPDFGPPQPMAAPQSNGAGGAILVIDTTAAREPGDATEGGPVRADSLPRRATTVPQGTLIPAVLETALDSTRSGYVRAIVSRDIAGFDGSRVLIPRGSRLFGEYQADLTAGQNRALVQWTRLVRPDGVAIALASPAADVAGRAGVPGRVDSHFLERFGSALLQTTLNVGASLAGRSLSADNAVVIALPSQTQGGIVSDGGGSRVQPTLRVDAGLRVMVFVARDLEFPARESRP